MKGYRLYGEASSNARKRKRLFDNVIAVEIDGQQRPYFLPLTSRGGPTVSCIAAVYAWENSPVCGCSLSLDYLRRNCTRISEQLARKIHPSLFVWLDSFDDEPEDEE